MVTRPPASAENSPSGAADALEMTNLYVKLRDGGHELQLALPSAAWLQLVSSFTRMPADDRQRVGSGIRAAVAVDPFPAEGGMTGAKAEVCDAFANDCVLLAALAEVVGDRVLADTAVEVYKLSAMSRLKQRLN